MNVYKLLTLCSPKKTKAKIVNTGKLPERHKRVYIANALKLKRDGDVIKC